MDFIKINYLYQNHLKYVVVVSIEWDVKQSIIMYLINNKDVTIYNMYKINIIINKKNIIRSKIFKKNSYITNNKIYQTNY
jgi:hypothetical protein